MGSRGSDRFISRNEQPESSSDSFFSKMLIALVGAGATVGAAFLVYELQTRDHVCSELQTDYYKADDLNDSAKKLKRFKFLLSANGIDQCSAYSKITQARDDLEKTFKDSITQRGDGTEILTGHAVGDGDTITAGTFVPDAQKIDSPRPQGTAAAQTALVPQPPPANGSAGAGMQALATNGPTAQIEFAPAPETPAVLTVTPNEISPFEGQIGDKLILHRGINYLLRPQQYYTTAYSVAGGDVMVSVNGKPYFHCKGGNTFRLYWKNIPDFSAVTHARLATLTVMDAESGSHLGDTDCEAAAG